MLKKLVLACSLGVLAVTVAQAGLRERLVDLPRHYSPGARDGAPVVAAAPDGTRWSAWAYRSAGEYSVAVAVTDDHGLWSDPVFFGLDDGVDQVQPDLQVDADGNFYLAFAVRQTGAVHVSALPAWREGWFEPQRVTEFARSASSPALRVVGDRLVMAYHAGRDGIEMLDWPLLTPPVVGPDGIQEGPDGFPLPLSHKWDRGKKESQDLPVGDWPSTDRAGPKREED